MLPVRPTVAVLAVIAALFSAPTWAAPAEPVIPLCGTNSSTPCGTAANPMVVDTGGGGSTDVNLTEVAGAAVKTGAGTAAGSIRVELPTDGTGKVGLSAGAAIVGKAGIDQTTPGTTNGVAIAPTAGAAAGIASVISASAEASHVLKAAPGNLYSVYATNLTATAGFLVVLNATAAPGDGAITPLDCAPLPANGSAAVNYRPGPAKIYSTGITAVVTSATTCFTKTTGVITAFISGDAQ